MPRMGPRLVIFSGLQSISMSTNFVRFLKAKKSNLREFGMMLLVPKLISLPSRDKMGKEQVKSATFAKSYLFKKIIRTVFGLY